MDNLAVFCFLMVLWKFGNCCTFPTDLQNSAWKPDTGENDITFGTSWVNIPEYSSITPNFTCHSLTEDTTGTGRDIYLLRSATTGDSFGNQVYYYLCWELIKQSSNSYIYYTTSPESIDGKRVKAELVATSVTTSSMCTESSTISEALYNVIISSGSETSAAQNCANNILGGYRFTYETNAGQECFDNMTTWDSCTDTTKVSLTPSCTIGGATETVAYTTGGSLICVASITGTSYMYQTMYNLDAAPLGNAQRAFTCWATAITGTDSDGATTTAKASVFPGPCISGQSPTGLPIDGVTTGALLVLTVTNQVCPIIATTEAPEEESDNTTTTIIIAVVVTIAVIGLLLLGLFLFYKFYWVPKHTVAPIKKTVIHNKKTKFEDPEKKAVTGSTNSTITRENVHVEVGEIPGSMSNGISAGQPLLYGGGNATYSANGSLANPRLGGYESNTDAVTMANGHVANENVVKRSGGDLRTGDPSVSPPVNPKPTNTSPSPRNAKPEPLSVIDMSWLSNKPSGLEMISEHETEAEIADSNNPFALDARALTTSWEPVKDSGKIGLVPGTTSAALFGAQSSNADKNTKMASPVVADMSAGVSQTGDTSVSPKEADEKSSKPKNDETAPISYPREKSNLLPPIETVEESLTPREDNGGENGTNGSQDNKKANKDSARSTARSTKDTKPPIRIPTGLDLFEENKLSAVQG